MLPIFRLQNIYKKSNIIVLVLMKKLCITIICEYNFYKEIFCQQFYFVSQKVMKKCCLHFGTVKEQIQILLLS